MKQTSKNKVTTLPEWLEIATRGLAAPGKERVTREIQAHYAEAVQARVAQGEPIKTAEAGAVGDLGNPKVAARRFKRSHFTTLEVKRISNLNRRRTIIPKLTFGYLPPVTLLLFTLVVVPSKLLLIFVALMFALIICPTISLIVSRRPASKARTLSLLRLDWVNSLITTFIILLIFILSSDRADQYFYIIVFAIFMLGNVLTSFFRWNRSRRMLDEIDENTGIVG